MYVLLIPSAGKRSTAAFLVEVVDAKCFLGERRVGVCAGLVALVWQCGKRQWMGGIARYGSRWFRRVLV